MTHTQVRFEASPIFGHSVVAITTTVKGGFTAHLIDTFSRVGVPVRKVESRMVRGSWVQSIVVAAPHGKPLDDEMLDVLRAAVFATIDVVTLNHTADGDEKDASSGTFRIGACRALSNRAREELARHR